MGRNNRWGGRLRLIPFLADEYSGEYELRELPEHIPMPRTFSRIYEDGKDLFATGVDDRGIMYLDVLNVSDLDPNDCEWGPLEYSPKNREIYFGLRNCFREDDWDTNNLDLTELSTNNYFEDDELDFDNEDYESDGFQGAD